MNETTASRTFKKAVLLSLLAIAAVVFAAPQNSAAALDPALQKITTYTFGESREALSVVEDLVRSSLNKPKELLKLEKQFATILKSDATYDCKDFICRQLWVAGTKESVPALKKLLMEEKTSDIARFALQQNKSANAGKALRDGLKKTDGKVLIGIINSLGVRGDRECVDALAGIIGRFEKMHENEGGENHENDDDKENEEARKKMHEARDAAVAAINALAKIGGSGVAQTLAGARYSSCPMVKKAAKEALLVWADSLVDK